MQGLVLYSVSRVVLSTQWYYFEGEKCVNTAPVLYCVLSIIEEEGRQFQTAVLQDFFQLADKFSPVLCLIHCHCLHCGYLCVGRIYYPTFFSF